MAESIILYSGNNPGGIWAKHGKSEILYAAPVGPCRGFADAVQKNGMQENTDILIVTHAFAIKTIFHLFAPEQLSGLGKVKNASVSRLIFENGIFSLEPDIQL